MVQEEVHVYQQKHWLKIPVSLFDFILTEKYGVFMKLDMVYQLHGWEGPQASSEEAAALEGPRIKQGELWSQLGGPQRQLGGP